MQLRRITWWLFTGGLLFMLILFRVTHKKKKTAHRSWLDFRDNETAEDVCDCEMILNGDADEIELSKILTITKSFKNHTYIPDAQYIELTNNCEKYRRSRKYLSVPLSTEEKAFSVAYSIVVHHKVQNFERLLRSIYTPQNFYCVHVDKKAPMSVMTGISGIVSCFDNVFLVSRRERVYYASWSRVQADINCMKDLYQVSNHWKYFINLCGQDFPIKTNLEIVRALKALAGANSLETETMPSSKNHRWMKKHRLINGIIRATNLNKEPPPFTLKIFSGGAYIVVSREFVRFVLEDPNAQMLMEWANDTYSPDELLWATLQRIPGVPGFLRPHSKYDISDIHSISRLVKWGPHELGFDAVYPRCHGIHIRNICVYGAGDLQWILEQHHLFANKFDTDVDPIAIRCLERYLRHKALKMQQ
ncbi:beta-1,3-galactosyl-O-glycosyl-glycoprotein beta-1,6-N-acetylglucosaminyltransferase-like [Trichomycterus rosablanca]|uniref:beta-1,3-galactosyl-O-glycosyl-glycoprotein beta-1,6-N-acetylglucosaminyltransferase-like n=1 Tax=Trichomycterus rosablanca TaxID=2290929 RepID=UPI002F35FE79